MAQEVTNFARFYAAINALPQVSDKDEFKRQVVMQYTWNRTDSLREMTRKEYSECCYALERLSGLTEKRKRERSICLKLMQEIGIDTTDWARVNDFCRHPRIAGKAFAQISIEDLEALSKKLRAIKRAGGLKDKRQTAESTTVYVVATAPNNLKS
jgi:hypothetical protein